MVQMAKLQYNLQPIQK